MRPLHPESGRLPCSQPVDSVLAASHVPGRVLLALDSWHNPSPLARVWCLLEIYIAMDVDAEIIMCLSDTEQESFTNKLAQNQVKLQRVLGAVCAEEAQSTIDKDRDMIFEMIRGGTGFKSFNHTIRDALRQSFELVAMSAAQQRF